MFLLTILAGAKTLRAQQPADQQPAAQQQSSTQQPSSTQPSSTQQPAEQPSTPQEPAAQQQPGNPPSGDQEAAPEEATRRRVKPKEYKNWAFNVGGGGSLTTGTTKTLVRGGGGVGAAGVARNFNKYFGFRLDFQWDNLPLRTTALELAQATGATSHVYTFTLEPVINIPVTKEWGAYVLLGPAYFHRTGRLDSSGALPGIGCDQFFQWWGRCYNSILPLNGNFLTSSVNEPGYDFAVAGTRKITDNVEIYLEFRQMHGSHNGITTDLRPITIGVRWGK
jgi:hypothetical protein